LRSRNCIGHVLHHRSSVPVTKPCQIPSKSSGKKSKSLSKLLVNRTENGKKIDSQLTERLHEPESLVASVEQDMHLISSDLTCKNSLLTDLLPDDSVVNRHLPEDCGSSDSNTVELSPYSSIDVNSSVDQNVHSVTFGSFPKNTSLADLLPYDLVFNDDFPEVCGSSNSNTVVLTPCSSMDDLTIAYRSPLSDVFDFDEPSVDQHESTGESLEAGNSSKKFDVITMDIDEELKPTSYPDCDRVISQPYGTTISGLVQFSRNQVESASLSTSLGCGLVTSSMANSEGLQSGPVQLMDSVNSERALCQNKFKDKDQKKCETSASVSFVVERLVPEMTDYVSSGTLTSTHSLTPSLSAAVDLGNDSTGPEEE